jgi:hypothetical protein
VEEIDLTPSRMDVIAQAQIDDGRSPLTKRDTEPWFVPLCEPRRRKREVLTSTNSRLIAPTEHHITTLSVPV